MENPYETPTSDPTLPGRGGIDTSSPLSPAGRFGRLSYIAWNMVLNVIGYLMLFLLGGNTIMTGADPEATMQFLATGGGMVAGVVSMLWFAVHIIFGIRRLHDVDKTGWLMLLIVIPLANLILWIYLLVARGTEGANRFAPHRPTPGWEKILGYIGVGVMILTLIIMAIGMIGMATSQM
ncbi:MAG: DUF805 domain-containing protein [Gammaproteobacteria bacterium]